MVTHARGDMMARQAAADENAAALFQRCFEDPTLPSSTSVQGGSSEPCSVFPAARAIPRRIFSTFGGNASTQSSSCPSSLLPFRPPRPSSAVFSSGVIEVRGCTGTGKSEVLLSAIVSSLVPLSFGGANGAVVLIDGDGKFDILRLHQLLDSRLSAVQGYSEERDSKAKEEMTMQCLRRMHVIRCRSSMELVASSLMLCRVLDGIVRAGEQPKLVVIDSLNTFYWMDRNVISRDGRDVLGLQRVHASLAEDVSLAVRRYGVGVIASVNVSESDTNWNGKETMTPEWQRIVNQRLLLSQNGQMRSALWASVSGRDGEEEHQYFTIHTKYGIQGC